MRGTSYLEMLLELRVIRGSLPAAMVQEERRLVVEPKLPEKKLRREALRRISARLEDRIAILWEPKRYRYEASVRIGNSVVEQHRCVKTRIPE
jgi:hypothetical protein